MNRRSFLTGLLGAAGAAAVAPSLVEAAEGLLVPERKVWALDRTHLSTPGIVLHPKQMYDMVNGQWFSYTEFRDEWGTKLIFDRVDVHPDRITVDTMRSSPPFVGVDAATGLFVDREQARTARGPIVVRGKVWVQAARLPSDPAWDKFIDLVTQ